MRSLSENSRYEDKLKDFSKENRELVLEFINDCYAEGLGKKRIDEYFGHLRNIIKILGINLAKATREDIKRLTREIEQSEYMDWTKHDYKVTIKKFWKWLRQSEDMYPEEVRWIKTTMKYANNKLPEDLLTQEDIRKLIENAINLRDKALISVIYESGCRIGEILSMRIKDVIFGEPTCSIRVSGKTGSRRLLLVDSTPYLSNWISHCANKDNPDSFLWTSIGTKNRNKVLKYNSLREILKAVSAKAGIKKRVNPHIFRHSRATHLANKLTEAQMCEYFGWRQGSDMPRTYVHLSGRDVDNAILEMHGLKKTDDKNDNTHLKQKQCSICGETNEFELDVCRRCARPLDFKSAMELINKEKKFLGWMPPRMVNEMIDIRVKEILKQKGIDKLIKNMESLLNAQGPRLSIKQIASKHDKH